LLLQELFYIVKQLQLVLLNMRRYFTTHKQMQQTLLLKQQLLQ